MPAPRNGLEAAKVTLKERGDKSTGWGHGPQAKPMGTSKKRHRAYKLYQDILTYGTLENLWGSHLLFK